MGLSAHAWAAKGAFALEIPPELVAKSLKKRDHSFLISAESVLKRLKLRQKIILIDVRNQEEFEKVSIPGSINVPLCFIKTKVFLKPNALVLVDKGCNNSRLEKECLSLRNSGFAVSILSGGLTSWRRKGGPLKGDLLHLKTYKEVSPQIFFQEKDYENQIVIDVSREPLEEAKKLIPYAIHIPFSDDTPDLSFLLSTLPAPSLARSGESKNYLNPDDLHFSAVIQDTIAKHKNKPSLTFLIFNETGGQYERIERILEKTVLENVFYLKGGLNAYKRFLQNLVLSRKSRKRRLRSMNRCRNCGQEN